MIEGQSFCSFQDYREPGALADYGLISTKDLLLNGVPEAPDLESRDQLITLAGLSFASGLLRLLRDGVKPQTLKNSTDIRLTQFLFRFSDAEIDVARDQTTTRSRDRAAEIFEGLVEEGKPIPGEVINRIEKSALAPKFKVQLDQLRKPADISHYMNLGSRQLVSEFGY